MEHQTTPDISAPPPRRQEWVPLAMGVVIAVVAIGAPALALSVGQTGSTTMADPADPGATVLVQPLGVSPSRVVIRAGQTVHFDIVSGDEPSAGTPHQISGAGFACPVMTSGSCSHSFDRPGTFSFTDALGHAGAAGVVLVEPGSPARGQ